MAINNLQVKRLLMACFAISFATVAGSQNACFGQSANSQILYSKETIKKAVHTLKNTQNPEFKAQRLVKPVTLAEMPEFPGKNVQFRNGTMFPNVKGGPSITEQFSLHEDKETVMRWYRSFFTQSRWNLVDDMSGNDCVVAMKSGNVCQVMISPSTYVGSKCDLLFRYKSYKPTDFSAN